MAATDTLLAQCVLRGVQAVAAADVAGGRDPNVPATRRETVRATIRGTRSGARVAALVVMWATALVDLDCDSIGIEDYSRWASEHRASAYRHLAEFRELWPEHHDPNELARLLIRHADGQALTPLVPLPLAA